MPARCQYNRGASAMMYFSAGCSDMKSFLSRLSFALTIRHMHLALRGRRWQGRARRPARESCRS